MKPIPDNSVRPVNQPVVVLLMRARLWFTVTNFSMRVKLFKLNFEETLQPQRHTKCKNEGQSRFYCANSAMAWPRINPVEQCIFILNWNMY